MPQDELIAVCDHCRVEVENGDGALDVDTGAVGRALDSARLESRPAPVPWTVRHTRCAGNRSHAYTIPVERVRTWAGLLSWWVHLTEKDWFPMTGWTELVASALNPHGEYSGLRPALPRDPRDGPVGDRPAR